MGKKNRKSIDISNVKNNQKMTQNVSKFRKW